jgi:hypothetical protein
MRFLANKVWISFVFEMSERNMSCHLSTVKVNYLLLLKQQKFYGTMEKGKMISLSKDQHGKG